MNASPIFPEGITPSSFELGGSAPEYCEIQIEENIEENLAEKTDEEITDELIEKNSNLELQDDFDYESRSEFISETDEVSEKLATESKESAIYRNALTEDIIETLGETSAKSSAEVGAEISEKLAAGLAAESNPITEIAMDLVMCAVSLAQDGIKDEYDTREIFDNCSGPIGMIDQLIEMLEMIINKISKLVTADRDFVRLIDERQHIVRDSIRGIDDDINNMASLVSQHNRALSKNISVGLRGLINDKINHALYKESKAIFNVTNDDLCKEERLNLEHDHNLTINKINISLIGRSSAGQDNKPIGSYIYFQEDDELEHLVVGYDDIIYGIGYITKSGRKEYFGNSHSKKIISVDNLIRIEVSSANYVGRYSGHYVSGLKFVYNDKPSVIVGNRNNTYGTNFRTTSVDINEKIRILAVNTEYNNNDFVRSILFASNDSEILPLANTTFQSYSNLYQCSAMQTKEGLNFLKAGSSFNTAITEYLIKHKEVVENKNMIVEHLRNLQKKLVQKHKQHMIDQLESYNTLKYLGVENNRKFNSISTINENLSDALNNQAPQVRKAHPIDNTLFSDIPFSSDDFVAIPNKLFSTGNEKMYYRIKLPLLDRRTILNIVDAKLYQKGVLNRHITSIPKRTETNLQRDKQILSSLLKIDSSHNIFTIEENNFNPLNIDEFITNYYRPLLERAYSRHLKRFPILRQFIVNNLNFVEKNMLSLNQFKNLYANGINDDYSCIDCTIPSPLNDHDEVKTYQTVSKDYIANKILEDEDWEHRYANWNKSGQYNSSTIILQASGAKAKIQQNKFYNNIHRALIYCPSDSLFNPNKLLIAEEINPHLVNEQIEDFALTPGKWWMYGKYSPELEYLALEMCGQSPSIPTSVLKSGNVEESTWKEEVVLGKDYGYTILTGKCSPNSQYNEGDDFHFIKSPISSYVNSLNENAHSANDLVVKHCGHDDYWLEESGIIEKTGTIFDDRLGSVNSTDAGYWGEQDYNDHRLDFTCGSHTMLANVQGTNIKGKIDQYKGCGGGRQTYDCSIKYKSTKWNIFGKNYTTKNTSDIREMVSDACGEILPDNWESDGAWGSVENLHSMPYMRLNWYEVGFSHGNEVKLYKAKDKEEIYKADIKCASDAKDDPNGEHRIFYHKKRVKADSGYRDDGESRSTKLNTTFHIHKDIDSDKPTYDIEQYNGKKLKFNIDEELALKQAVMDMAAKQCGVGGYSNDLEHKVSGNKFYTAKTYTKKESLTNYDRSNRTGYNRLTIKCGEEAVNNPGTIKSIYRKDSDKWNIDGLSYSSSSNLSREKSMVLTFCGASDFKMHQVEFDSGTALAHYSPTVGFIDGKGIKLTCNSNASLNKNKSTQYEEKLWYGYTKRTRWAHFNIVGSKKYYHYWTNGHKFQYKWKTKTFHDEIKATSSLVKDSIRDDSNTLIKKFCGVDIRKTFRRVGINIIKIDDKLKIKVDNNEVLSTKGKGIKYLGNLMENKSNIDFNYKVINSGCFGWGIHMDIFSDGLKVFKANKGGGWTHCGTKLNKTRKIWANTVEHKWKNSAGKNSNSRNNPTYRLTIEETANATIDLKSSADTYLYLKNFENKILRKDDNGGERTNSRIKRKLYKGTYNIVAATYRSKINADFELTVRVDKLKGRWLFGSGGRNVNSKNNPRFYFDIYSPKDVEINLTSRADTYLYLLDSKGKIIAYDDDGAGSDLNSKIKKSLKKGSYSVVVATYNKNKLEIFNLSASGIKFKMPLARIN